ncbi:hypothetical protein CS542_01015 [Pedobacter sp. IW39]|nr:hypothetical protein CS542_01015 [Pedobacter sp. IW39]
MPMPVYLHYNENVSWINESGTRWLDPNTTRRIACNWSRRHINFLDAFPISTSSGGVKGVACRCIKHSFLESKAINSI